MDADARTAYTVRGLSITSYERRTCATSNKQSRETHCSYRALGEDHSRPLGSPRRVSRSSGHRHSSEAWQGNQPRRNHPRIDRSCFPEQRRSFTGGFDRIARRASDRFADEESENPLTAGCCTPPAFRAQFACRELSDLMLTACNSEVDLALLDAVENRADRMGPPECLWHRGINLVRHLCQKRSVPLREENGLCRRG